MNSLERTMSGTPNNSYNGCFHTPNTSKLNMSWKACKSRCWRRWLLSDRFGRPPNPTPPAWPTGASGHAVPPPTTGTLLRVQEQIEGCSPAHASVQSSQWLSRQKRKPQVRSHRIYATQWAFAMSINEYNGLQIGGGETIQI